MNHFYHVAAFYILGWSIMTGCTGARGDETECELPNVVLIYADDLGYGDVGAYGATEIRTPHMDRLAKEGMMFTSGYASSATCTPSMRMR